MRFPERIEAPCDGPLPLVQHPQYAEAQPDRLRTPVECRCAWLQSRRMRATNQQALISAVFEAAEHATQTLAHLTPDIDRDRTEYAVASTLLEEAWVSQR